MATRTTNTAKVMTKGRTKAAANTGVAVLEDGGVIATLDILKTELAALKAVTESSYKTEGSVSGVNIQSETKIEELIKLSASVRARALAYQEELIFLGITSAPVFKIGNYTAESIITDIKLRLAVVEHKERKEELEALVKEGEKFLTEKDQFLLYQAKLAKIITRK